MMKKFKKIAAMAASMLVLASGMTTLDSNAIYCAVSAFKDLSNWVLFPSSDGYMITHSIHLIPEKKVRPI